MANSVDIIGGLPNDCLSEILRRLEPRKAAHCGEVSKQWYQVTREPALWSKIIPSLPFSREQTISLYWRNKVLLTLPSSTVEFVAERCSFFFQNLPFGKTGEFTLINTDFRWNAKIKFGSGTNDKHTPPDITAGLLFNPLITIAEQGYTVNITRSPPAILLQFAFITISDCQKDFSEELLAKLKDVCRAKMNELENAAKAALPGPSNPGQA